MISAVAASVYEIDLNDADHLALIQNNTLELYVGDSIRIVANENPSTGYIWIYNDKTTDIFTVILDEHRDGNTAYDLDGETVYGAGTGGVRVFELKAISIGSAKFELVYARVWEFTGFNSELDSSSYLFYH